MPYKFATYNFQDDARAGAAHDGMHGLEADGWEIVAASPTFIEMSVLWHKPLAVEVLEVQGHCEGCQCPPDGVHVDWHMTQEESEELFRVLRQHQDVPYIAELLSEGVIPPEPGPVAEE